MTPLILVILALCLASNAYVLSKLHQPPPAPDPSTQFLVHEDNSDVLKLAIQEMSKVAQLAVQPIQVSAETPNETLPAAREMGMQFNQWPDDEKDPMEVFLGDDFIREATAVLDEGGDLGVPGLTVDWSGGRGAA